MAANWRIDQSKAQKYMTDIVALYKRRPDLKAFLELFLSLSAIGVFTLFAIRPTLLTITQLLKDIEGKKQTIAQMDQKIANLQIAQTILQSQKAKIDLLAQAIPDKAELGAYVRQIEGLSTRNSVSIISLGSGELTIFGPDRGKSSAPVGVETGPQFPQPGKPVDINISITGDYSNISTFLKNVETLRRPMFFEHVTFSSNPTELGQTLVLTIAGKIPYQEEVRQ